jgi:hypothetical protein
LLLLFHLHELILRSSNEADDHVDMFMEAKSILEADNEEPGNCVRGIVDLSVLVFWQMPCLPSTETTMSEPLDLNALQDSNFDLLDSCE